MAPRREGSLRQLVWWLHVREHSEVPQEPGGSDEDCLLEEGSEVAEALSEDEGGV